MSLDTDNAAAHRFYSLVRQFCLRARGWTEGAVRVETTPAERMDITKLSQRVYGTRDEVLVVLAAAGMDMLTEPMPQQQIMLPTPGKLLQLKREAGFESAHAQRRDGKPIWKRGD